VTDNVSTRDATHLKKVRLISFLQSITNLGLQYFCNCKKLLEMLRGNLYLLRMWLKTNCIINNIHLDTDL
jgi:hypothetical protein